MNQEELLYRAIRFYQAELTWIHSRMTVIKWSEVCGKQELICLARRHKTLTQTLVDLLAEYVRNRPQQRALLEERMFEHQLHQILSGYKITVN